MSSENPESKNSPDLKTRDDQEQKQPSEQAPEGEPEEVTEEDGEEEGECGFCLFMKAGGCKASFVAWEDCVKAAEDQNEDIAEKCFQATSALMKCMEAHSDYYAPILGVEKRVEEEALKELEEEKAKEEKGKEEEEEKENSMDLGKK